MRDFDPALVSYAGASVLAGFGLAIAMPCGFAASHTPLLVSRLADLSRPQEASRESRHLPELRGTAWCCSALLIGVPICAGPTHWFLAWGCILAARSDLPLVLRWVPIETAATNQKIYRGFLFGSFRSGSFHLLERMLPNSPLGHSRYCGRQWFCIGVFFALWRRGLRPWCMECGSSLQRTCLPLHISSSPFRSRLCSSPSPHILMRVFITDFSS